jgi:hypothetical protein
VVTVVLVLQIHYQVLLSLTLAEAVVVPIKELQVLAVQAVVVMETSAETALQELLTQVEAAAVEVQTSEQAVLAVQVLSLFPTH